MHYLLQTCTRRDSRISSGHGPILNSFSVAIVIPYLSLPLGSFLGPETGCKSSTRLDALSSMARLGSEQIKKKAKKEDGATT